MCCWKEIFQTPWNVELKYFVWSELLEKAVSNCCFSGLLNKSQFFIGQSNKCQNKMDIGHGVSSEVQGVWKNIFTKSDHNPTLNF